jgi:hypothetical protein
MSDEIVKLIIRVTEDYKERFNLPAFKKLLEDHYGFKGGGSDTQVTMGKPIKKENAHDDN